MTEEELAEEYADKNKVYIDFDDDITDYSNVKEAFLAGLKAGRPQWHDLRKDPNDLPKKVGNYILDTACERHTFELSFVDYFEDKHWIDEENHNIEGYDEGVIAWCEIPTFTDKE